MIDEEGVEALAPPRVMADGERTERDTVVGHIRADNLPARFVAGSDMVLPRQAHGGLDGFRPATHEEGARHPFRQPVRDEPFDEPRTVLVRPRWDDVGALLEDARGDLGHLCAAPANVRDDCATGGIEDAAAIWRDQVGTLSAGNFGRCRVRDECGAAGSFGFHCEECYSIGGWHPWNWQRGTAL